MRLTKVEIRNFRSIFEEEGVGRGLTLDVANGLNVLVGKNNCGKSNVFRAIGAALDPAFTYRPESDNPGPLVGRYPSVQLWFECDPSAEEERRLLDLAADCEKVATDVAKDQTRSARNQFVIRTTFAPAQDGGVARRDRVVYSDGSDDPGKAEVQGLLAPTIEQFRSLVRFVMVRSGESIESVLEGNFREILHTVVREQLGHQFDTAEQHRSEYIKGLQSDLLAPLRDRIREVVSKLFPEINDITLAPEVSAIDETLSHVAIGLVDAVESPLAEKGTGVRGGVLVAMLRYLAMHASRCVVFAVEEPEAFLHPAAQEALRSDLESLAERDDVSVLVTTHSPFIVSQSESSQSVLLQKDADGRTRIGQVSTGGDETVAVISGLMREDSALPGLIARATQVSAGKKAVLLVEGYTDGRYIKLAAEMLGRPELIADIEIVAAHGTTQMENTACVARATSSVPIAALLDADGPGKRAFDRLKSLEVEKKPLFQKNKSLFSYSIVFQGDYAWEAEDLFPPELIKEYVDANGGSDAWELCTGYEQRKNFGPHYDLVGEAKFGLEAFLRSRLVPEDLDRWAELFAKIRFGLKLGDPPAPANPPTPPKEVRAVDRADSAATAKVRLPDNEPAETPVLIVSENFGHAEYLRSGVFAGEPGRGLSPDIRYVGFYEGGAILAEIPRVLARHDDLLFTERTAERLAESASESDRRIAVFIREELESGRREEGDVRQVMLLSDPDSAETLVLPSPVQNTKKSPKGRPMAWVVRHRVTRLGALRRLPQHTDQLEQWEQEVGR